MPRETNASKRERERERKCVRVCERERGERRQQEEILFLDTRTAGKGRVGGKRARLREAIARSRRNVNSRNNLITDRLDLKVEAKLHPLNVSTRFRRVNS